MGFGPNLSCGLGFSTHSPLHEPPRNWYFWNFGHQLFDLSFLLHCARVYLGSVWERATLDEQYFPGSSVTAIESQLSGFCVETTVFVAMKSEEITRCGLEGRRNLMVETVVFSSSSLYPGLLKKKLWTRFKNWFVLSARLSSYGCTREVRTETLEAFRVFFDERVQTKRVGVGR